VRSIGSRIALVIVEVVVVVVVPLLSGGEALIDEEGNDVDAVNEHKS
jgi:hypothetical protein